MLLKQKFFYQVFCLFTVPQIGLESNLLSQPYNGYLSGSTRQCGIVQWYEKWKWLVTVGIEESELKGGKERCRVVLPKDHIVSQKIIKDQHLAKPPFQCTFASLPLLPTFFHANTFYVPTPPFHTKYTSKSGIRISIFFLFSSYSYILTFSFENLFKLYQFLLNLICILFYTSFLPQVISLIQMNWSSVNNKKVI